MQKKYLHHKKLLAFLFGLFFMNCVTAQVVVKDLQVEYTKTPIGIDVKVPRFGWRMQAPAGARNYSQTHYQLTVKDAKGYMTWNSPKTAGNLSVGIAYKGKVLQPATRYYWTVTVWDNKGGVSKESSWFETGLMNTGADAWHSAEWIGGGDEDLVLYSKYLPLFALKCEVTIAKGSSRASLLLAANDPRLMDRNKNIFQVESPINQSYFKVELDVSAVRANGSGKARVNVYRAGYTPKDNPLIPVKSFEVKPAVINNDNKNLSHEISIRDLHGMLFIVLDKDTSFFSVAADTKNAPKEAVVSLNPVGEWGDHIGFGMLCDLGFAVDHGQQASFKNLTVYNLRNPSNILFSEDLSYPVYKGIYKDAADGKGGFQVRNNAYELNGSKSSVFVVADPSRNAMPMLRSGFTLAAKKISSARLYVTSRGIYEMYLNGSRVGKDYYNPGLTQYNLTHLYQTYDVTDLVHHGKNAIGAMLGEGWWSGLLSYGSNWNYFGDRQSLLAQLVINYADGKKDVVISNSRTWKYYNDGPVVYSSLNMGEVYDATKETAVHNWSKAGYDDRAWKPAVEVPLSRVVSDHLSYDSLSLVGQIGENAGIYKVLTATSVKKVARGVYIYDMGQNFTGVPRISIANGNKGQKLTIRVAEMLYPDLPEYGKNVGLMMTENYRAALSQDDYVMRSGPQVWQPHFTSHGYQYIEVSGLDEALPLNAVQGLCISSISRLTAGYETSNHKINKLWSNLVWSNIDNFLSIPTDCPQRNERMGWSGDINVFSRTATYVSNADQFLRRHLLAMRDVQTQQGRFTDIAPIGGGFGGLLWGSAGITVPWEAFEQYSDTALLREHYPAMVKYISYLDSRIDSKTGLCTDNQLGDWLGPQNSKLGNDYLVTAYHVYDLDIMYRAALLLGYKKDADRFEQMHKERKAFFNRTFVSTDKIALAFIDGNFKDADVQTAYAVGLALNAFSEENIPFMSKQLKTAVERKNTGDDGVERPPYSLMTGFIGTAWISKALSDYGYDTEAYRLLQNDQYPSWLYSVKQGATTIWERLNGYTVEKGFGGNNGMNSFNHYSFGAVGQWMIAYSLGIQRGTPGFKRFILRPEPDPTGEMSWAKGYYDSPYGRISSEWKTEKGRLLYKATVPANTTATLYLPAINAENVKEGGRPVAANTNIQIIRFQNGKAIYELKSGDYEFIAPL